MMSRREALRQAIYSHDLVRVKQALQLPSEFACQENCEFAVSALSETFNQDIMLELVKQSGVDKVYDQVLSVVIALDRTKPLEYLLNTTTSPPPQTELDLLESAVYSHSEQALQLLLQRWNDPALYNRGFYTAFQHGTVNVIRLHRWNDPTLYNRVFYTAIQHGTVNMVRLLLNDSRVKPDARQTTHYLLRTTNLDVVRCVLRSQVQLSESVALSAVRDHVDTGNLQVWLDEWTSLSRSTLGHVWLQDALDRRWNRDDVVPLVLQHERIDVQELFCEAFDHNNLELLQAILKYANTRVDPRNLELRRLVSRMSFTDGSIVLPLLSHPKTGIWQLLRLLVSANQDTFQTLFVPLVRQAIARRLPLQRLTPPTPHHIDYTDPSLEAEFHTIQQAVEAVAVEEEEEEPSLVRLMLQSVLSEETRLRQRIFRQTVQRIYDE